MLPLEAFDWIESNVQQGSTIIEFGSGHGSLRLSENYDVHSVEHDGEWIGIAPVTYIHAPIVPNPTSEKYQEVGWYDISMLQHRLPLSAKLLIIDGPPERFGRSGLLGNLAIIPRGITILLDDYSRETERNLAAKIMENGWHKPKVIVSKQLRKDGTNREFCILHPKITIFNRLFLWARQKIFL